MKTRARMGMIGKCAALAAAVSATALAGAAMAQGQPDPAEQAIETRQSVFKLIVWNMSPLFPMMRGGDIDAERVALSAERIGALAPMIPDLFAMDTSETDFETEALDGIWASQDAFHDRAADLVAAAAALKEAADSGDEAAIRPAIGAVGQACSGCHDNFRAD